MSNEKQRIDDQVNDSGEPISAAHKAIYEHLDECKDEVKSHIDHVMDRHRERDHIELMARADILAYRDQDRATISEIANMALGTPKTALRGGGRESDGWDSIIRNNRQMIEDLHDKLGNGQKLKMSLDWKQTTTALAFILFTVAKQLGLF